MIKGNIFSKKMIEENSWWEETRYMLQSAVSYTSIAKVQLMNHQRIVNVWHMFNKNKTRWYQIISQSWARESLQQVMYTGGK